jgi:hypothetical protein
MVPYQTIPYVSYCTIRRIYISARCAETIRLLNARDYERKIAPRLDLFHLWNSLLCFMIRAATSLVWRWNNFLREPRSGKVKLDESSPSNIIVY